MKNKKLVVILCAVLGILILTLILILVFKKKPAETLTPEVTITAGVSESTTTTTQVVTSKTATKTATQTAVQTATQTVTSTVASKSKIDLIKEALNAKFSNPITDASISKESENSAYGSFSIGQEGGYFVAVKDGNSWKIIADGNGTIECSILDANNVPASVVGECYDTPSDSAKTR